MSLLLLLLVVSAALSMTSGQVPYGCEWSVGEGISDSYRDVWMGRVANDSVCLEQCLQLRRTTRPNVNSMTVNRDGTECMCKENVKVS